MSILSDFDARFVLALRAVANEFLIMGKNVFSRSSSPDFVMDTLCEQYSGGADGAVARYCIVLRINEEKLLSMMPGIMFAFEMGRVLWR